MKKSWKVLVVTFMLSQIVSLLGSSLVQYALSWHINIETQSGLMMTLSILCGFLPTFLISPFAGVWADRYNRKWLVILADGLIAGTTLVIAILIMMGYQEMWLLFLAMAIRGLGQGIQSPAVSAILPQLVPEEHLTKVNSIQGTVQSMIMLVSPVLAAGLMGFMNMGSILLIDVITAVLAIAILILFISIPNEKGSETSDAKGYFNDLKLGYDYILAHPFLKQLFMFCAIFYICAGPIAFLSPLQVTRLFGPETWRLSAIEIAFSVGMILGGVGMMVWGGFKNRNHSMTLSSFIMALCTLLIGLFPQFWVYIVFMGVMGLSMPLFNTPFTVILQEKIEIEYLGRVFGFLGMLSSIGMPVSILIFGPLSDLISLNLIFIITGVGLLISSWLMLINKPMIEAGK